MLRQPPLRHPNICTSQPHKPRLPTLGILTPYSRDSRTVFILLEILEHATGHVRCCVGAEGPGGGGVALD